MSNQGLTSLDGIENLPKALQDASHGQIDVSQPHTLKLHNNYLREIPDGALSPFIGLKVLDASNNRLQVFPINPQEPAVIEELELSHNDFTELPVGSLDKYTSLKKLFLVDNKITRVQDKVFDELSSLEEVHLEYNKISNIGSKIFVRNPLLRVIHLQFNNIPHLPLTLFDGLTLLTEIDLTGNMLDMPALEHYKFPESAQIAYRPQRVPPLRILAAMAYQKSFLENLGLEMLNK